MFISTENVTVGFEQTFTSVVEDVGLFELCVVLKTFDNVLSENIAISLNLFTTPDTAGISKTSYIVHVHKGGHPLQVGYQLVTLSPGALIL